MIMLGLTDIEITYIGDGLEIQCIKVYEKVMLDNIKENRIIINTEKDEKQY